jgi:hypothetical protein
MGDPDEYFEIVNVGFTSIFSPGCGFAEEQNDKARRAKQMAFAKHNIFPGNRYTDSG